MKKATLLRGYLFVIVSAFLFGCMPLLTKSIYAQGVNALSVVFLRNAMSVPLLGLLAKLCKQPLRIPGKALLSISAVGIAGCCLTPLLLFGSYVYIASGTATVFHFIYPALTVVGGMLFLRERTTAGILVSVALCLVGICMFYTPGQMLDWRGAVMAIASGVTYAVYILLLSVFPYKEISGFRFSFWVSSISTALLLIACLVSGQLTFPATAAGWLLCLLLSFVINVGAVVMFQQGAFLIGGQRASILSTVEPITSILIGVLFLQETVGVSAVIGSAFVVLASILIALFDIQRNKKDP